jgi:hypothetical protein
VDLYAIIKLLPFEKKLLRFPYAVREEGEAKSIFLKAIISDLSDEMMCFIKRTSKSLSARIYE